MSIKVLIATEGSKFSNDAIDKCCRIFADSKDTEFRVISVFEPAIVATEPFAVSAEYIRDVNESARKHAEEVVSQAESAIRSKFSSFEPEISTFVENGSPARSIVEEAEKWNADLIVTGSHGHGFWKRTWLGSVSNAVVQHAPCSVLVVRSKESSDN